MKFEEANRSVPGHGKRQDHFIPSHSIWEEETGVLERQGPKVFGLARTTSSLLVALLSELVRSEL